MNQYPKKLIESKYLNKVSKLSIIAILVILIFTGIFHFFDHTHFNGFGEEKEEGNKLMNRLYFTMTTFSSTGYGDTSPNSLEVRIISMVLQFILVIAMLGGVLEFE